MSKEKGLVAKFKEMISKATEKLSVSEALELAELATSAAELKFVDVTIGDKSYKVEGDLIEVGAVISEVMEDESLGEVADGEYELAVVDADPIKVIVKDSKIDEVLAAEEVPAVEEVVEVVAEEEVVAAKEEEEEEMKYSEERMAKLEAEVAELKEMLKSYFKEEALDTKLSEMKEKIEINLKEELSNIPAMGTERVKQSFSKTEKKNPNDLISKFREINNK